MSAVIINEHPRSFLIGLATRATGSAGFAKSLLAICTMWLLPELKPAMPYHRRRRASGHRTKGRSTPVTSSRLSSSPPPARASTLPSTPVQSSPLQRPSLQHSRRSSFGIAFSNIARSSLSTSRKWSFGPTSSRNKDSFSSSSTSPRSSVTTSESASDSTPDSDKDFQTSGRTHQFRRPRLSFPTRLPNLKEAVGVTQGRGPVSSARQCELVTRSKTTSEMLSREPTKSPKGNVTFTHPWSMSRSRTSTTSSTTPSEFTVTKPSRLPFKRNLSNCRPAPPSPLAPLCSSPSSPCHPRKESYSLYLRGLPRFEGAINTGPARARCGFDEGISLHTNTAKADTPPSGRRT